MMSPSKFVVGADIPQFVCRFLERGYRSGSGKHSFPWYSALPVPGACAARYPKDRDDYGGPLADIVKLIDEVMMVERGSVEYTVVEGNSRMRPTTP
jgi:hypothetical protein